MLFNQPAVSLEEFESRSGWHLRPEGLCRDDLCVPLSGPVVHGNQLDLRAVADALGMPLVADAGLIALGPRAANHVLQTVAAPEVVLPDVHGNLFDLASLRGTKVLLLAWASW
jgi:hypothetical protein